MKQSDDVARGRDVRVEDGAAPHGVAAPLTPTRLEGARVPPTDPLRHRPSGYLDAPLVIPPEDLTRERANVTMPLAEPRSTPLAASAFHAALCPARRSGRSLSIQSGRSSPRAH